MSRCVLPDDVTASGVARHHLRLVGADWGADVLESVLLATSELVTNAVVHGGDHPALDVLTCAVGIRVEVSDDGRTGADVPRGPRPGGDGAPVADEGLRLGGRGLQIVAALTERWGVVSRRPGTCVWFEVPLAERSPREAPVRPRG